MEYSASFKPALNIAQLNGSSYFAHPIVSWSGSGLQSSSRLYTLVRQQYKLQTTKNWGDDKITLTDTGPSPCSAWAYQAYLVLLSVSLSLSS